MKHLALLLLVLTAVILAACSPTEAAVPVPEPAEPLDVSLMATDIAFNQNEVEVEAGRPVRLTLQNQGVLEHDFSIMEIPLNGRITMTMTNADVGAHDMGHMSDMPKLHLAAPTNGSNAIEFTPSTPGEYQFYCTVAGHREAGMVGTLIVKES
jgi:uncharacterized cupredoxin-like copper-binding protein